MLEQTEHISNGILFQRSATIRGGLIREVNSVVRFPEGRGGITVSRRGKYGAPFDDSRPEINWPAYGSVSEDEAESFKRLLEAAIEEAGNLGAISAEELYLFQGEQPKQEEEKMEMKTFDRADWDAFAGAERGPNGEEPEICYGIVILERKGLEAVIIADAQGVGVDLYDDEGTDYGHWMRDDSNFYLNLTIARGLVSDGELNLDWINKAGFQEIGGPHA